MLPVVESKGTVCLTSGIEKMEQSSSEAKYFFLILTEKIFEYYYIVLPSTVLSSLIICLDWIMASIIRNS